MAILVLLQLALPGSVLAWLVLARFRSGAWRVAAIAGSAVFVLGVLLAGVWVYPPVWMAATTLLTGLALAWPSVMRAPKRALSTASTLLSAAVLAAVATLGGALAWHGVAGRIAPRGESYDLSPPLRGGGNCVISGGASPLLNFHMATLAPGKEAFRGQSFGADFIAVSPLGLRTTDDAWWNPRPSAPTRYRIFGAPVHAPCAGAVLEAIDGVSDQRAGVVDRAHMAGNHVILQCGAHEVLLAHMRQGSVRVAAGQSVRVGDILGEVGNSGNSDEPHLHVSVQRRSGETQGLGGAPVHVTFSGRFLARHACL